MTITNDDIYTLASEAAQAGDRRQQVICYVAAGEEAAVIDGYHDLAEERESLGGMTQAEARAECEQIILEAQAQED